VNLCVASARLFCEGLKNRPGTALFVALAYKGVMARWVPYSMWLRGVKVKFSFNLWFTKTINMGKGPLDTAPKQLGQGARASWVSCPKWLGKAPDYLGQGTPCAGKNIHAGNLRCWPVKK